jgi:hypothetical protein
MDVSVLHIKVVFGCEVNHHVSTSVDTIYRCGATRGSLTSRSLASARYAAGRSPFPAPCSPGALERLKASCPFAVRSPLLGAVPMNYDPAPHSPSLHWAGGEQGF